MTLTQAQKNDRKVAKLELDEITDSMRRFDHQADGGVVDLVDKDGCHRHLHMSPEAAAVANRLNVRELLVERLACAFERYRGLTA